MDKEQIIFKLEQVKAIFGVFSCLNEDARIADVAYIATEYKDIVQYIIEKYERV